MKKHRVSMEHFSAHIRRKIAHGSVEGQPEKELWLVYSKATEQAWFVVEFQGYSVWEKSNKLTLEEAINFYNEI